MEIDCVAYVDSACVPDDISVRHPLLGIDSGITLYTEGDGGERQLWKA